jgi:hypothetical protein
MAKYTPNTTVQPMARGGGNIDEMIAMIQGELQRRRQTEAFQMQKANFQRGVEKDKMDMDAVKALYQPDIDQLDTKIKAGLATDEEMKVRQELVRNQGLGTSYVQGRKVYEDLLGKQEQEAKALNRKTSYGYLNEAYSGDTEALKIIKDNASIGNPPEKALADIQGMLTRRNAIEAAKAGKGADIALGTAEDINFKNLMRDTGKTYGIHNVIAVDGTDRNVVLETTEGDRKFRKIHDSYFEYNKKTGKWESAEILKEKKGNIFKSSDNYNTIKPQYKSVVESLNAAYGDWQKYAVGSKGKDTTQFESRFRK